MSLQNQTYANSGNGYYIQSATPIIPGDQGIRGPIEILPATQTGPTPAYYNTIFQTDGQGLSIEERKTDDNALLSAVRLGTDYTVGITSGFPNATSVLLLNVNSQVKGQATIAANAGLVVADSSFSGTLLQIVHDNINNNNNIQNITSYNSPTPVNGARMSFKGNTGKLVFENTNNLANTVAINSDASQISVISSFTNTSTTMTCGGIAMASAGTAKARLGLFGGNHLLIESAGNTYITTNTIGTAYDAITAFQNGTVSFLSTIIAPTGNISTVNSSTLNSITGNITTLNTSTITNTGNASMGNDTSSRYITTTNNYTNNPIPYTRYNYFQGQMVYNSLRDAHGAPASAIQSLEIINTSGNNTVGGIQFYTSVNADIPNPVWMGGFQTATSEFKLPSTVTASLPQITNVSTINSIAINSFGNPIGTIISFAMLTPPSGYLLCNGQAVSQTTYAPLYAVIGTTYGGGGGNFNLPDCLGKVMMGAIAGYAPGGTAPTEGYNAVATFQGFVSGISAPFGSVTTGMYFSSSTKPITAGMLSGSQALFQSASYVVQYVVASDGMRSGINRGFLIMFEGNCGPNVFAPRIAQGDTVAFNANPATSPGQNYPQLGNQDNTTIGTGTMGIWQDPSQVGSHTHNIPQGGAQAAPGATYRAGDPNTGGPASGSPNSDFSFTAPAYGGFPSFGVTAPRTMFSQPYNLGVSMCIKY